LIKALTQLIGREGIRLAAPTAAAGYLIGGKTLHSLFRLGFNSVHGSQLKSPALDTFIEEMQGVKLIVLDEVSMIGVERFS
jgi:hypothetical protein